MQVRVVAFWLQLPKAFQVDSETTLLAGGDNREPWGPSNPVALARHLPFEALLPIRIFYALPRGLTGMTTCTHHQPRAYQQGQNGRQDDCRHCIFES